MTGMQAARLKAESQGRKAKVRKSQEELVSVRMLKADGLTYCATACQFIP